MSFSQSSSQYSWIKVININYKKKTLGKIEELEKPTHFITNIISLLCFIAIIVGGFDLDITLFFIFI